MLRKPILGKCFHISANSVLLLKTNLCGTHLSTAHVIVFGCMQKLEDCIFPMPKGIDWRTPFCHQKICCRKPFVCPDRDRAFSCFSERGMGQSFLIQFYDAGNESVSSLEIGPCLSEKGVGVCHLCWLIQKQFCNWLQTKHERRPFSPHVANTQTDWLILQHSQAHHTECVCCPGFQPCSPRLDSHSLIPKICADCFPWRLCWLYFERVVLRFSPLSVPSCPFRDSTKHGEECGLDFLRTVPHSHVVRVRTKRNDAPIARLLGQQFFEKVLAHGIK